MGNSGKAMAISAEKPNLNPMVSHSLSSLELRFKAYILEATRTWHNMFNINFLIPDVIQF